MRYIGLFMVLGILVGCGADTQPHSNMICVSQVTTYIHVRTGKTTTLVPRHWCGKYQTIYRQVARRGE